MFTFGPLAAEQVARFVEEDGIAARAIALVACQISGRPRCFLHEGP